MRKTKRKTGWPREAVEVLLNVDWTEEGDILTLFHGSALKGLLACPRRPWADTGTYLAELAQEIADECLQRLASDDTPEGVGDILEGIAVASLEGVCAHPDSMSKKPSEIVDVVVEQARAAVIVMANTLVGDEDDDEEDEDDDDDEDDER